MPTITPTYAVRFILALLALIFAAFTAMTGIHTLSAWWLIVMLAAAILLP